jgi:2-keto-3-deoxy-L-rhamnonate aldolase RhmA
MAATGGFDWLAIDMKRSFISLEQAQEMMQGIDLAGISPLVRLTSNDENLIKRVMDAGAHGVIVPLVSSKEDAERAVASVYCPPRGIRGTGLGRAQGYGATFPEYKKWLTENGNAIYFSREPIPSRKKYDKAFPMLKQVAKFPSVATICWNTTIPTDTA